MGNLRKALSLFQMTLVVTCLCSVTTSTAVDEFESPPTREFIPIPLPVLTEPSEWRAEPFPTTDPPAILEAPQPCSCQNDLHSHRDYLKHCGYPFLKDGYLKHRWHYHIKPWLHATHWGYQESFIPDPLGSSVYAHMNAHVGNGQAAQLVLYRFDFFEGLLGEPAKLNSYGVDRLRKMSRLLAHSPLPLVIERTRNQPELDEARRIFVVNELAKVSSIPISAERVIVAEPTALGIRGTEGFEIYQNLLEQTRIRGGFLQFGRSNSFTP